MEKNQKEVFTKMNFLKKMWYSISKFEKYPELAALGVKKALIYVIELTLIFSIFYVGTYVYYVSNVAEFEEEDLTLSQKIVRLLINDEQSPEMLELAKVVEQSPETTIIVSLFISMFISYYLAILIDTFTLSIFGLFTCFIAKIKMNYKAVFNMSIYALTLPTILRIIYEQITMLTDFEIKYFDIMYISIAYISLAAAIFLIKSDLIKQQLELMKIIEQSKQKIEQTITIPKRPKEKKKDEDDKDEKEDNQDKEEKGQHGGEEQGSNA